MGRQRHGNKRRLPRGETVEQAQRARRLRAFSTRSECVRYVRERDDDTCRLCGRHVQYAVDVALDFGEVHEFVFRSRGGSDVEPTNTVLVCKGCHTGVEPCIHPGAFHKRKRVIVPIDDDVLMEGPILYHDVPLGDDVAGEPT